MEDATNGVPSSWTKNVSTATMSASSSSNTGASALSLNKVNSTTGTIYAYQDVDIENDAYYSLSGFVVKNSANFAYCLLRISWRDSGSAEISKTDSPPLSSNSSTFQSIKITSVQAPSSAVKARIELVANIETVNPSTAILFDDIEFAQILPPNQPTESPTNTPTQKPTATSTPTIKPTEVVTPTIVSISTLGEESISSDEALVLGQTFSSSPAIEKAEGTDSAKARSFFPKTSFIASTFILVGVGLLGFSGYSLFQKFKGE